MSVDLLLLAVGALLLAAFAAGMYLLPFADSRDPSLRSDLGRAAIILTTIVGLCGAPFWWLDLELSFAWNLPALGSRLVAVAGVAFGITGLMVLGFPSPRRTRLYLIMIVVYTVPLLASAALFHLDRFDFGHLDSWGFFLITGGMAAAASIELMRVMSTHPGLPTRRFDGQVIPVWLVLVGVMMIGWALALYLAPDTIFPAVFVWPKDPLSSRLIAAALLTIGAAALLSTSDVKSGKLALSLHGIYGVGVIAALGVKASNGLPIPLLYGLGIGASGMVSLAFFAMLLSSDRSPGAQRQRSAH